MQINVTTPPRGKCASSALNVNAPTGWARRFADRRHGLRQTRSRNDGADDQCNQPS